MKWRFWMFWWKKECPYVLKEVCKVTHTNLDHRLNRQDYLLYAILLIVLSIFGRVAGFFKF
jgi:hypothetical protein